MKSHFTYPGCRIQAHPPSNLFLFLSHTVWSPTGTCGGSSSGLLAKSCLTLATPWTVAYQAPLSLRFPRLEYWSGLPFPLQGILQGILRTQGLNLSLLHGRGSFYLWAAGDYSWPQTIQGLQVFTSQQARLFLTCEDSSFSGCPKTRLGFRLLGSFNLQG